MPYLVRLQQDKLRWLLGPQISHYFYFKFQPLIFSLFIFRKENCSYILALKFEYFPMSLYRAILLKKIKMALLKQKYMYYLINGFNGMIIWRIHYVHTLGQCPRGAIYRRCTRRCSKTCDEPKKTGYCRDKCQPACICPGKRVLHNGKCIAPHTCPGAPSPSL